MRTILSFILLAVLWSSPLSQARERVLIIPLDGTIDMGLAPMVERALQQAEDGKYAAAILEINTFGGRIDAAVAIRDALVKSKVHSAAFIKNRAISAGALISLSCEHIYMARGSSIGAATPIAIGLQGASETDEKTVSYFRAEMRSTAERRGRPAKLAEAMVDKDVDLPPLAPKGKLLTMTDGDALASKFIDGRAESLQEVLSQLELNDAELIRVEINWAERIVRFLTDPTVSSLLMGLGMLGIFMELKAPGTFIGAGIAAVAFGLFFFGHYLVELAGMGELLLFLAGISLLLVEIFLLPGFGLAGLAGIILLLVGLIMALMGSQVPITIPALGDAAMVLSRAVAGAGILALLLIRFLPSSKLGKSMVLASVLPSAPQSKGIPLTLVGQRGIAVTTLRPAGTVEIGGKRFDALTEGTFLEAGSAIVIDEVRGSSLLVSAAPQE